MEWNRLPCSNGMEPAPMQYKRLQDLPEGEEANADQDCREHASLLRVLIDQHDPTRERQFAAHLDRLPPEGEAFVVGREERGRTAEARWSARADRVAACPKQKSVHDGNADRPHKHQDGCDTLRQRILSSVASDIQILGHVSPRLASIVFYPITKKRLEDARRRARHHQECHTQRKRQDISQTCEHNRPGRLRHQYVAGFSTSSLCKLSARCHPQPRAIRSEAVTRDEEFFYVGWHLENTNPHRVLLKTWRCRHIEHAGSRSHTLVKPHERLDLVAHARGVPKFLERHNFVPEQAACLRTARATLRCRSSTNGSSKQKQGAA
eukprot:7378306-Prymnesium_polylepis.4